jgi:UDPglucose 6-dehydrogenase
MTEQISINIIGFGFVGEAHGFLCEKNNLNFNVCDIQKKEGNFNYFSNVSELIKHSESNSNVQYIIISVPTPSDSEGNCDITIVDNVLSQLSNLITKETYIIIKSTLVPGTCEKLNLEYPKLNIVLCPEFLREKTYKNDIYNAEFILLGIPSDFGMIKFQKILRVMKLFYKHNNQIDIIMKNYEECEIFKYTINNFLGVKVWYFNKIYDLCSTMNVDYEVIKTMLKLDPRIGEYGTTVPGNHGRGFSGTCIPKDQLGLIRLLEKLDIDNSVLTAISIDNIKMREKN